MALLTFETIALGGTVLLLLYYYLTSTFNFWKSRGVPGPKPVPFFGTTKNVLTGARSPSLYFVDIYQQYKDEPMVGVYFGRSPILVLRDPNLMKDVFIKDFAKFVDRTLLPNTKVEPLSEHLFRLDAHRWRALRTRLSPVFTSGKLKEMFHLLLECGEQFDKYMDMIVVKGEPVECRELTAKFTTDVIGCCAFGIEMNAMSMETSEFRDKGREVFRTSWKSVLRDRMREMPIIFRYFGRFIVNYDVQNFFIRITKEAIDYRIKNNVRRHDFIDTLVDLKQRPDKVGADALDDGFLAAQAFVFFAAGFETSSITITNALYELALNHTIQEKLRKEIKDTIKKNDGMIKYEMIKDMKYLNAFFQEVLRKYPPLLSLSRTALTDYTFEGTNVTIPKGQKIFIPIYAIHHDPEIYPDPEVFDPERFTEENIGSRHPMNYLPFGDGPRNCIGARFAVYQTKVGIMKVLSKWKVDVCEKTKIPYELNPKTLFLLQPSHEVYVNMTKLEEE